MPSMNNNVTVAIIDTLIEENYERYVFVHFISRYSMSVTELQDIRYIFTLLQISSLGEQFKFKFQKKRLHNTKPQAFLFYAALSNLAEEIEYIWLKPFSLPTILYIFARYAILIGEGLSFTANKLVPVSWAQVYLIFIYLLIDLNCL